VTKTKELEAKLAKKDNVIAEVAAELVATKKRLGCPERSLGATEIAADRFVAWIGVARGKFFASEKRYGKANEHNGHVPRDHWLLDQEKRKIIGFHERFPLERYRRLTFMMIDQEVVAASPSSVYRVLAGAGLLSRRSVPMAVHGSRQDPRRSDQVAVLGPAPELVDSKRATHARLAGSPS